MSSIPPITKADLSDLLEHWIAEAKAEKARKAEAAEAEAERIRRAELAEAQRLLDSADLDIRLDIEGTALNASLGATFAAEAILQRRKQLQQKRKGGR